MKNLLAFLLWGGLSCLPLGAQSQTLPAEEALLPREKALLWKISGADLPQPSYLYGTIHLIGKEDFHLSDSLLAALDSAQEVVFEVDLEQINNLPAQMGLLMKTFMEGDLTLRDLLSEEDYALVEAHFRKMGLPLFLFERMKPLFLSVFASADLSPEGLSLGEAVSYEFELMDLARAKGKRMGGLETIEFQMSIFDSIPYQEQAQMLVETIRSGGGEGGELEKMVQLYKDQDIQAMVELMGGEEAGGFQDYEHLLLTLRNRNWIPIMEEKMRQGPVLFAVGAGHLAGAEGVIALLRRQGYTVQAIAPRTKP